MIFNTVLEVLVKEIKCESEALFFKNLFSKKKYIKSRKVKELRTLRINETVRN